MLRRLSALAALAVISGGLWPAVAAGAQSGGPAQPIDPTAAAQGRAPAPDNAQTLATIVATAGQRLQVRILVDPAITFSATPTAPGADLDIVGTMDALAAQIPAGTWRKVYLPQVAGLEPTAEKVAAVVKALETIEQAGVVVENPKTQKLTSYLKGVAAPANIEDTLAEQKFNTKPVYFLTSTATGPAKPDAQKLMDLQRQMAQMMLQMPLQDVSRSVASIAQMLFNVDPQTRMQVMGGFLMGIRSAVAQMTPPQRQQLFIEIRQMFRDVSDANGGQMRPGGLMGPGAQMP